MYVLIVKEKCNQCNMLKNLLDEKGIQYHYVDMLSSTLIEVRTSVKRDLM
jgi:glutaredoxin